MPCWTSAVAAHSQKLSELLIQSVLQLEEDGERELQQVSFVPPTIEETACKWRSPERFSAPSSNYSFYEVT